MCLSKTLRFSASAVAMVAAAPVIAGAAWAQSAGNNSTEQVVVTGTRIQNGNAMPTPVTVLSSEQLATTAPADLADALNKLPIFETGKGANLNFNSGGVSGLSSAGSYLNLRDMGSIRTLVLVDGIREAGTFYDTSIDIDMIPQMLIKRVDVVTGGASAVYGSDAVSGVVNFITDNKFDGVKGLVQGGISTYGDVGSYKAGFAGGMDVLGDRGHIEGSIEWYYRGGIPDAAARPYGLLFPGTVGAGTAASPFTLAFNLRQNNQAPGGLVVGGPFNGQQFIAANGGTLVPFNPGTPTKTTNIAIGGDGGVQHDQTLLPQANFVQSFARFDYQFSDDLSAYISVNYSFAHATQAANTISNVPTAYPLYIYSDNAYLKPAYAAQLTPGSSFELNRYDNDLASRLRYVYGTGAGAVTVGFQGTLPFRDFTWDAHFRHSDSLESQMSHGNVSSQRLFAAADAVVDPSTGNIVCHVSITAPGAYPGCVPINLFGQGNITQAGFNYIEGNTQWAVHNVMDDGAVNATGTIFDGWAGPIKAAAGLEYRAVAQNMHTSVNNGNVFNPQYLRLAPPGTFCPTPGSLASCQSAIAAGTVLVSPTGTFPSSNLYWMKEVFTGTPTVAEGAENVGEGDVEVDAPILKDLPLIQLLSVSGAYRYTQYRAGSGVLGVKSSFSSNTWRYGIEWQVFDDLHFRGTESRDIRAPTLYDLYQQQLIRSSGFVDSLVTNIQGSLNTLSGGNPNLKPEVASNTTLGAVYEPSWFPHFSVSVDYFHLNINNAIGSVAGNNTQLQQDCINSGGTSPYCALLVRPFPITNTTSANYPTLNISLNQNIVKTYTEGQDIELNYNNDMGNIVDGWEGTLGLRLLYEHQPTLKTLSLPGAVVTNVAGTSAAAADKATIIFNYKLDDYGVNIVQRYYGPIHYSSNPTIIYAIPDVRPYLQTDLNLTYDFVPYEIPTEAFLNINNVWNAKGGILAAGTGAIGQNYPVSNFADVIGRYFTLGVRIRS